MCSVSDFLRLKIFQRFGEIPCLYILVDLLHDGIIAFHRLKFRKKYAGFFNRAQTFYLFEGEFMFAFRCRVINLKEKLRVRLGRGGQLIVRTGCQKQGTGQCRRTVKQFPDPCLVQFLRKSHCTLNSQNL